MVEHVLIPDAGIHEPKGVSSAASGTVYIADGAGSGSWLSYPFDTAASISLSRSVAQGYIIGSALTTTPLGTGSANALIVNFGTAFLAGPAERFNVANSGRITYTGTDTRFFNILASTYSGQATAADKVYTFYFAVNGVIVANSASRINTKGTTNETCSVNCVVELATNDYIELWVSGETDTTALTVDTASITVTAV